MRQILPMPKGAKATILDVKQYNNWKHRPPELRKRGEPNVLFIVYKDESGKKGVKMIPRPKMEIGFTKPEYRNEWTTNRAYVPIDKVYLEEVEATKVLGRIADEARKCTDERSRSLVKIYENAYATGNYGARKEMFKFHHTFMSDISVEDSYRIHLALQYDLMQNHIVNKAFLDIENDIQGLSTSELEDHMAPTTAVTVIFDYDPIKHAVEGGGQPLVCTFLLRDYDKYPQQEYFEKNLNKFIKQCHDEFDQVTVKIKGKTFIAPNTVAKYNIKFYDSEEELLHAVFELINGVKPDTIAVWNIAYDIPQMKGRMEHLGMDPITEMCDKAFPKEFQFLEINIDRRGNIDQADRKTFIKMASTTNYIDQMQTYAQIRKGRKSYGSNKLDNIASIELDIGKRVFPDGVDVTNAPTKDWWDYILYNINDVWLQVLIDRYTNDILSLVIDSNQAACAIENLTKQTRYQKQIYYLNYLRRSFIAGTNKNNDYIGGKTDDKADMIRELKEAKKMRKLLDDESDDDEDNKDDSNDTEETADYTEYIDDEDDPDVIAANQINDIYSDSPDRKMRLKGGLVGNPNLNGENGIDLIEGVHSKHVFANVVDFDYKSLYPFVKYTRSVTGPTQIGRLIIPHRISPKQNPLDTPNYIPGAEFISDYIAQDWLHFGSVWFNLPTLDEIEGELDL